MQITIIRRSFTHPTHFTMSQRPAPSAILGIAPERIPLPKDELCTRFAEDRKLLILTNYSDTVALTHGYACLSTNQ